MPKIVDDKIFADTLAYLGSRPYTEVVGGIAQLGQAVDSGKLFEGLATFIRTGQLPQGNVPAGLATDPAFVDFYKALFERVAPAVDGQSPDLPSRP